MAKYDIYKLAYSESFYLYANKIESVDLALEKSSIPIKTCLIGRVFCECQPAVNAEVIVLDKDFNPKYTTKTNCYGGYVFKDILPPGTYWIMAGSKHCKASKLKRIKIRQNHLLKVNFYLKISTRADKACVYGIIRNSFNHKPIENANVKLIKCSTQKLYALAYTNELGQYLFNNIKPGSYIIKAYHKDYLYYRSHKICLRKEELCKHNIRLIYIT